MAVQYNKDDNRWSGLLADIYNAKKGIREVSDEATKFFDKTKDWKNTSLVITDENKFNSFIKKMNLADESLIDFLKDTKYGKKDLESYQQYLKDTGKSTSTFTSFTKKAGAALKSFGAAMASMGINWVIGEVIAFVATNIEKFGNASKHAAENAKALASEMNNSISSMSSNASTLSGLNDEYQKLSKGVNKLGENINLSAEDYNRYKEIISQVSTIMPNMSTYFNDQGEKIAFAKGNLEDLNKEYDEYFKRQAQDYIANGDDDGNTVQDILDSYNSNKEFTGFEKFWNKFKNAHGAIEPENFTTKEIIDELENFKDRNYIQNSIEKLNSHFRKNFNPYRIAFGVQNYYDQDTALKRMIINELGLNGKTQDDIINMTESEYNAIMQKINAYIQKYNTKIVSDMNQIHTTLIGLAYGDDSYWENDQDTKNDIITFLSSINSDVWNALQKNTDIEIIEFVNSIITSMSNNTNGFADAWNGLFSPDLNELPVKESSQKVNEFLRTICNTLGLDLENGMPLLRISLGLDLYDDTSRKLQNSIRRITDDHGQRDHEAYKYLESEVDFNNFTQEQAEFWLEATLGAENATQAVEMYKAALEEAAKGDPSPISDIFSLKGTDGTLTALGKLSESIDTIQNAYKTLYSAMEEYNREGSFSVDTLQSVIALGDDWLDYLVDEDGKLKLDKESLESLTQARLNDMRVQAINNVIKKVDDIRDEASANEYLASTNYALADSYEAAEDELSDAKENMKKAVDAGDLSQAGMDAVMDKAYADIAKINKLFADTKFIPPGSSGSGSSEFSETIDFFKRRVEVLDDALSHLKASMDNVSGSFGKNNLVDAQLGITEEKFRDYTDAVSIYTQKANEALSRLPADIADKVKNGAVELKDFVGDNNKDVVEAIKDYQSWANEIADCRQELAGLQKEIRQLELQKFNNIMDDFNDQFDLRENGKDLISKQMDLLKEAGQLIGESFFTAQIDQSKKQLELLEAEKAQLVNQMTSAVHSGRVN